jgi:hypothetical protein
MSQTLNGYMNSRFFTKEGWKVEQNAKKKMTFAKISVETQ